jgi:hypothetical protein
MRGLRPILFGSAATLMAMTGTLAAGRQAGPQPPSGGAPQIAEKVFKDIQVLKGITVDEFMDTMGMFAAATTKDCTGCHAPQILSGSRDAFATPTPMIQRARQMTVMMNTINRTFFGSQPRVTCYTCHSATASPQRVPNLEIQYGTPPLDNPDRLEFVALPDRANEVDSIFARFVQAVGGAERWAGVSSLAASGTYAGWDTSRVEVPVELFGRAPNQFTTVVHRKEGDNVFVFNGLNARAEFHAPVHRRQPHRRTDRCARSDRSPHDSEGVLAVAGQRGRGGGRARDGAAGHQSG